MTNYEDDSFAYQQEEDLGFESTAPPDVEPNTFTREDLLNAQDLRSSHYRKLALDEFRKLDASEELKQAYARWVNSYFSADVLLSNTTTRKTGIFSSKNKMDSVMAKADLNLWKCAFSANKRDTLQPWCGAM